MVRLRLVPKVVLEGNWGLLESKSGVEGDEEINKPRKVIYAGGRGLAIGVL